MSEAIYPLTQYGTEWYNLFVKQSGYTVSEGRKNDVEEVNFIHLHYVSDIAG